MILMILMILIILMILMIICSILKFKLIRIFILYKKSIFYHIYNHTINQMKSILRHQAFKSFSTSNNNKLSSLIQKTAENLQQ